MLRVGALALAIVSCFVLSGCLPEGSPVSAPTTNVGDPNQHQGCEVKNNGSTNPCATGNGASANANAVLPPPPPMPAGCKLKYYPPSAYVYPGNIAQRQVAAERDSAAWKVCWEYATGLTRRIPPDQQGKGWANVDPKGAALGMEAYRIAAALTDRSHAYGKSLILKPYVPPTASSKPATTQGGGACSNPYGGSSAQHDQFICSNQGEILACQCSGSSCRLVNTGGMQCTKPGAVFN